MIRQEVTSLLLQSIGYDPQDNILEIEFWDGEIHQYTGVPESAYTELMEADSHGWHFRIKFAGKYPSNKIEP